MSKSVDTCDGEDGLEEMLLEERNKAFWERKKYRIQRKQAIQDSGQVAREVNRLFP